LVCETPNPVNRIGYKSCKYGPKLRQYGQNSFINCNSMVFNDQNPVMLHCSGRLFDLSSRSDCSATRCEDTGIMTSGTSKPRPNDLSRGAVPAAAGATAGWDCWFGAKPAAADIPGPFEEQAASGRDGGSSWQRSDNVAVWNLVISEDRYPTR
jgi:hypothetical protein